MLHSDLIFPTCWFNTGFGQEHEAREHTGKVSGGTKVKRMGRPFHSIRALAFSPKVMGVGWREESLREGWMEWVTVSVVSLRGRDKNNREARGFLSCGVNFVGTNWRKSSHQVLSRYCNSKSRELLCSWACSLSHAYSLQTFLFKNFLVRISKLNVYLEHIFQLVRSIIRQLFILSCLKEKVPEMEDLGV